MSKKIKTDKKLPPRNFISSFYTQEEEAIMKRRPKCDRCGHRITEDTLYEIDGELFCDDCMVELFERDTKDYIE